MNESIHTLTSSNIKDIEDIEDIEDLGEHDILEFEANLI